jgi:putative thioredoxin
MFCAAIKAPRMSDKMANSPWIIDVAESDFEREVIDRSRERPVVVDFWAPWCGPCRALGPILERLAQERHGDFILAKINTDEAQNLAMAFRIEGIPAVKAFRDGNLILEFTGLLPESQLREFIDRICPSEADRLTKQAAALEGREPAKAESLYQQALVIQRDHQTALVGLARLLLARGDETQATELVERVIPGSELASEVDRLRGLMDLRRLARECGDESTALGRVAAEPKNAEARYALGCVLAAAGRYPEALAELLAAAERDQQLARGKVREAMLRIFHIVGVRSELADEYRDKLTRLMY